MKAVPEPSFNILELFFKCHIRFDVSLFCFFVNKAIFERDYVGFLVLWVYTNSVTGQFRDFGYELWPV